MNAIFHLLAIWGILGVFLTVPIAFSDEGMAFVMTHPWMMIVFGPVMWITLIGLFILVTVPFIVIYLKENLDMIRFFQAQQKDIDNSKKH